jgi:putative flippase GtrA
MNQKVAITVDENSRYIVSKDVASIILCWLRHSEFMRYFAVSLLAFMLDLGAFSASLRIFGLPWAVAATLGFVVGLLVAYVLSVRFVFTNRKLRQAPSVELLTFSLVGVCGLGVTQLVLWFGIERLNANPEVSKFCAAGFTFIFNFVVRKLMLFSAAANSSLNLESNHDSY